VGRQNLRDAGRVAATDMTLDRLLPRHFTREVREELVGDERLERSARIGEIDFQDVGIMLASDNGYLQSVPLRTLSPPSG
jgi:hypothetical protein